MEIKHILSTVRQAVDEYNLIEEGDKIAVGISGGKDSLALLCALAYLKKFYPKNFSLISLCVDSGFAGAGYGTEEKAKDNFDKLRDFSHNLGVEFHLVSTHIAQVVFDVKNEKNPCSLCAKMRRGALQNTASELGCNKLALGHHFDDAVETFVMNLFNEGRIGSFPPVVHFDRSNITVIRPLVYTREKDITYFSNKANLPVIESPCPQDKNSGREDVKKLLKTLEKDYKNLKKNIMGAMKRANVDGYLEK